MHRQRAGTPNEEGWYDAKSTEGHFRVSLPVPFNDFTVKVKEKDVNAVGEFVVDKLRTVPGISKTLTIMVFDPVKESMDVPLDP